MGLNPKGMLGSSYGLLRGDAFPHSSNRIITHTQSHYLLQQGFILLAAMFRRVSEVLLMRDLGIWIHLKHIHAASLRQPVVDPRIPAQTENPVNAFREPFEFFLCFFLNH